MTRVIALKIANGPHGENKHLTEGFGSVNATAARPTESGSCHYYHRDGTPVYEVPRASGDGMRPTTLADARKLGLLPSVTTILGVLHKEALVQWRVEQAVLACVTSPRNDGEPLDQFIQRILHTERVQDQESDKAKQRGTEIHDALEGWALGCPSVESVRPWVVPVMNYLHSFGTVVSAEKVVVGDGYAGRTDLIQRYPGGIRIWDFKTTKKLPQKEAWKEHVLQCAAYAKAFKDKDAAISTGNIYISTIEPGQFVVHEHGPWFGVFLEGFDPLLTHWRWANNYYP